MLDETGSATAFASILAISFVPMILGAPFGGVLADRMNRRTLMVILDAASAVTVALALVWFSAAGFSIIAVGVMQVALSLLGIFKTPTVESALPQMLCQYGDATLNTSAAIVSQVQQVSALIPSFLGGAVYSFFGIRPMIAASVAAFAGAAAIECFIRLDMPERNEEMPTPLDDLKAALRFLPRGKTEPAENDPARLRAELGRTRLWRRRIRVRHPHAMGGGSTRPSTALPTD
ncbi:MFS transporter [Bifidobacterium bifidum]|uniref:MFS transporter n=1 Tax=Bifidobacterium bifidum TaxID=1681 RepID=UPI0027E1F85C|nr:MFS transporter [Bifidobacterium bifidum]